MKSIMTHQFSQVPKIGIERSSFDRSHGHKTTFDAGKLVPIFLDEILPGDTFNLNMTGFARMATPIFPVMDNMYMDTHFFFVPTRLVWDNWKKFNGEQLNPGDSIDYTIPQLATSGITEGSIGDYMGLPVGTTGTLNHSVLPGRCYLAIYNEWFRDQNLQDTIAVQTSDSGQVGSASHVNYNFSPLPRGKRHDYFTSCLTAPQKGDSVSLPLGTSADVMGIGIRGDHGTAGSLTTFKQSDDTTSTVTGWSGLTATGTPAAGQTNIQIEQGTTGFPKIYADLTSATAATINEIRQAFQIQRLLEKDARGGTRYNELIKSHFGVTVPDYRIQRPEYLGGGSSSVNISPIAQTSATASQPTPQGNLSALATASLKNHGFTKSFTEHGYVIGLVSVRADLTYQQGLDRLWSRDTRYDFYQPTLSHLGEEAVLSKEIYTDGTAGDETVFGYQERYASYRYKSSKISGAFRSNAAAPLDSWHLSQEFSTRPTLNDTFIEENPPIDRVIATPAEPHFIFDSYFKLKCSRPMPVYSVPGQMDHF